MSLSENENGMQFKLLSSFTRRQSKKYSPLLKDYKNNIEMKELSFHALNKESKKEETELFLDSEIDQIDISHRGELKKKFQNGVFGNSQARKLFRKIDVEALTLKREEALRRHMLGWTIWYVLHIFLAFIIIISPVSLMSQGIKANDSLNKAIYSMVDDLKAEPIMDIQLIKASEECYDGYENMLLGEWPGTPDACFCPSTNSLSKGSCSSVRQFLTECHDIPKIDPMSLFTWKGMKWCEKRAKINQDYVKTSLCPTGYTNCSFGLCMKDGLSCPITSITLNEGQENSFTFLRETNKPLLARVGVFMQNISCFGVSEKNSPYTLLNEGSSECNQYGLDGELNRFLEQQRMEMFLKENKAPKEVYSLPLYLERLKENEAVFYQRRLIEVDQKTECEDLDFENLLSKLNDSSVLETEKLFVCGRLILIGLWIIFGSVYLKIQKLFSSCTRVKVLHFVMLWGLASTIYTLVEGVYYMGPSISADRGMSISQCFSASSLHSRFQDVNSLFSVPYLLFIYHSFMFLIFMILRAIFKYHKLM